MLDTMFEMISALRCCWYLSAYSIAKHAAPGLAVEVEVGLVEVQRLAHLLDLFDEARHVPQLRLIRLIAVIGAELIVVVYSIPARGKVAVEGLEVLVRPPGRRAAAGP